MMSFLYKEFSFRSDEVFVFKEEMSKKKNKQKSKISPIYFISSQLWAFDVFDVS